jgi:hypothetical protein
MQRRSTVNISLALRVIIPVALLTWIVCFWRGEQLLAWYPIPVKGTAGRIVIASVFAILAVVFGLVATAVYGRLAATRPDTAALIYRWAGLGLAVLLSIVGFIVPGALQKKGPVVAWTLTNLLWGVGYGWVLPLLLR